MTTPRAARQAMTIPTEIRTMQSPEFKDKPAATSDIVVNVITSLVVIALVGVLIVVSFQEGDGKQKKTPAENAHLYPQVTAGVEALIREGVVLKVEAKGHRVYVSPLAWAIANIEQKEDLTASFAIYCAAKSGDDQVRVTVLDHQTGKQLASYSTFFGFSVE